MNKKIIYRIIGAIIGAIFGMLVAASAIGLPSLLPFLGMLYPLFLLIPIEWIVLNLIDPLIPISISGGESSGWMLLPILAGVVGAVYGYLIGWLIQWVKCICISKLILL